MQSLSTVSVILTLFAQSGQSSADWLPHRVHHGEPTRGDYPAKEDADTNKVGYPHSCHIWKFQLKLAIGGYFEIRM